MSFEARTHHAQDFAAVARQHPERVLLALDFDGTLAPIVDDPEESRMHPQAAQALAALGPELGQIAIITGRGVEAVRRLGELDSRVGLERVIVLGQYGVERYDASTGRLRSPEAPPAIATARREVVRVLAELSAKSVPVAGTYVEDKGRALGVHTRRADNPQAALDALADPLAEIAQRLGLHVEPGRQVVELRTSRQTKGDALRELVAEVEPGAVAMVGDDLGDLPAFAALPDLRLDGLTCCGVYSASGEQDALAEHADVICDGPEGVAQWLASLRSE